MTVGAEWCTELEPVQVLWETSGSKHVVISCAYPVVASGCTYCCNSFESDFAQVFLAGVDMTKKLGLLKQPCKQPTIPQSLGGYFEMPVCPRVYFHDTVLRVRYEF